MTEHSFGAVGEKIPTGSHVGSAITVFLSGNPLMFWTCLVLSRHGRGLKNLPPYRI